MRLRPREILAPVCLAGVIAILLGVVLAPVPENLVLAAVLGVAVLLIASGILDGGLSNALVLFTVGYVLYNTSLLISHTVFGLDEFALGVVLADPESSRFCTYVIVGLLTFGATYMILRVVAPVRKVPIRVVPTPPADHRTMLASALCLLVVGAVITLPFLKSVGGVGGFVSLPYVTRHLATRGWGMSTAGTYLINAGFVLMYLYTTKRGLRSRLLLLGLMAGYALVLASTGRRAPLFLMAGSLFIAHDSMVAPIRFRTAAVLSIVAAVVLLIIGRVRSASGPAISSTTIRFAIENFDWAWVDPGRTEWASASLVMLTLLRYVPWLYPYAGGKTYLNGFLSLIPSRVWPGRPDLPSQWFAKEFFPDVYNQGGGFGFSFLGEAYLNFGSIGIILCSCLVGILLFALERARKKPSLDTALVYALIAPSVILLPRLDLGCFLKSCLLSAAFPYGLIWAVRLTGHLVRLRSVGRRAIVKDGDAL